MPGYYILVGHTPYPTNDVKKWGQWFRTAPRYQRKVAHTESDDGKVSVSTVFLGIDYSHGDSQAPLLFETMVFGGEHDGEMCRYSTWKQAENGHKKMCKRFLGKESE